MRPVVARGLLTTAFLFGLVMDAAAGYAWYAGKPWHVIFGLILIGVLNHPSMQPTLQKWAKEDDLTKRHNIFCTRNGIGHCPACDTRAQFDRESG